MGNVKRGSKAPVVFLLGLMSPAGTLLASAQTGSIEFVARITPASGRAEPVRGLPFYLLRKSFTDAEKEADASEPKPDLNRFVDGLSVSNELKAWMKRTKTVELSSGNLADHMKTDDIFNVPEFFAAYLARNAGDTGVGFPAPKYRERDKQRNPQKYEKLRQDYLAAIRKFLEDNSQSKDGMEIELAPIDPSQRWAQERAERRERVHRRGLELAQTHYLVAKTETDLDGRGAFAGLSPGRYWLSTLEIEAEVGDVHLRWDRPVEVRAGEITRIELSNVNSVHRDRPTH
jgi:hypothetical protein